jgi:hypothetical protein
MTALIKQELNEQMTISELSQLFKELKDTKTDQQSTLAHEKKKRAIIELVVKRIEKECAMVERDDQNKKDAQSASCTQQSLYYFLLGFGMFRDAARSYLFGLIVLSLIPGLMNPILIAGSALYAALDCILFYAFEVSLLKRALGIAYEDIDESLEVYSQQMALTLEMVLCLPALVLTDEHKNYREFLALVHADLEEKHTKMGEYTESIYQKGFKCAIIGFGAFSSGAGSYYFMVNVFLAVWAASLIGTPVGFALIALTIVAGLGFYYAMGASSMARLANKDYEQFKNLKKEYGFFEKKFENGETILQTAEKNAEPYKDKISLTISAASIV